MKEFVGFLNKLWLTAVILLILLTVGSYLMEKQNKIAYEQLTGNVISQDVWSALPLSVQQEAVVNAFHKVYGS